MKEHPLSDWTYSYFANLLIPLKFVKRQITRIAGIQHHAMAAWLLGAPVMNSL